MFTKYVWKWDNPTRIFHIDNVEVKDKDGEVWLATGTVRLEQASPNGAWWRGDGECTILDGEEEKEVVFINKETRDKVTSHCDELSEEYDKWEKLSVRLEKVLTDDGPKTKVFAEKQNPAWIYSSNKSAVISENDPTHKDDDGVSWIERGSEEDADYDPDDVEELNENYNKSELFERVMRNSRWLHEAEDGGFDTVVSIFKKSKLKCDFEDGHSSGNDFIILKHLSEKYDDYVFIVPMTWEACQFLTSRRCGKGIRAAWPVGYRDSDAYFNEVVDKGGLIVCAYSTNELGKRYLIVKSPIDAPTKVASTDDVPLTLEDIGLDSEFENELIKNYKEYILYDHISYEVDD